MSTVFYYKGLTCEFDDSIPRLTIEGRKVPVAFTDSRFESTELPNKTTQTLRELAKIIVDKSARKKWSPISPPISPPRKRGQVYEL